MTTLNILCPMNVLGRKKQSKRKIRTSEEETKWRENDGYNYVRNKREVPERNVLESIMPKCLEGCKEVKMRADKSSDIWKN